MALLLASSGVQGKPTKHMHAFHSLCPEVNDMSTAFTGVSGDSSLIRVTSFRMLKITSCAVPCLLAYSRSDLPHQLLRMDSVAQPCSEDKLCLAERTQFVHLMACYDELLKSQVPDMPALRDQRPLLASRLGLEACISYASDTDPSASDLADLSAEDISQARLEWQQTRALQAAVAEQEERLRSMRADAAVQVEKQLQMIQQNASVREDIESFSLEENVKQDLQGQASNTSLAEQKEAMQQKWSVIQDELARSRQYLRVADVKAGDLAKRRRSQLPIALHVTDS